MDTVKNQKILIVGAFPKHTGKVFGGQITSSQILLNSSLNTDFKIVTLDSTQKSNPPPHFFIRLLFAAHRFSKWIIILITHRPQVVLLFFASGASAVEKGLMAKLCYLVNIPVIVLPRAEDFITDCRNSLLTRRIAKYLFGTASKVICQGKKFQTFSKEYLGIKKIDAPVIKNWTATSELLSIGAKRREYGQTQPIKILFMAWVEERKGIFDLAQAIEILNDRRVDFRLTIAGDGSALETVKTLIKNKNLKKKVDFTGWVSGEEKLNLFKSHDIFVSPSWAEGFPNSLVEAMAAGLASVVTDVGTISDVVNDGKEVLLTRSKDSETLANKIQLLDFDRKLMNSISINAHLFADREFNANKSIIELSKIISKLINK